MKSIKGIIVPIITPFYEDESLNLEELRRQSDRMIREGVDGIFCFGTNGEGFILNGDEKRQVLQTVLEQVGGRVPVYAGTGCISTRETVKQSLMAKELGADVLSLITPSFAKASQEELYQHYKSVAEKVDMPILLYNIPARTGNALEPETVSRLAEIPNIVGVKDSSGNWENLKAYLAITKKRPDFCVLSGNDSLILDTLMEGGAGAIAGCANVYPRTMSSIYDFFVEGQGEKAREAQNSIASFRAVFSYGNPNTIVKKAVNLLGYPVGPCKAPFNGLSEEGQAALKKVLAENQAKGMC
ncbi:4-hydroxy-tetrahydrodipicolinate synthase [Hominifimenecus sp. rT4P-3]|uniref:4-hydroxy-tetrahydrodipicolinate synthase n=1 Tax=Hominifimenecus sp. rT4P-3 TaxID=3242979 RepID=UPI003DA470C8